VEATPGLRLPLLDECVGGAVLGLNDHAWCLVVWLSKGIILVELDIHMNNLG